MLTRESQIGGEGRETEELVALGEEGGFRE